MNDVLVDAQFDRQFRQQAGAIDGIDVGVYRQYDKDPLAPVIGLGDANLRIALFGRDPGREEVRHGEPFIGTGGQKVRQALYQHLHGVPLPDFAASVTVGRAFFWANTVPYKPVGNKAWPMAVKKRFQPLMAELLAMHWHGTDIITLGREAFLWFGIGQPKVERDRLLAFWQSANRFQSSVSVDVGAPGQAQRAVRLHPLPHPSPLNATWFKRFPDLLGARLTQLHARIGNMQLPPP